MPINVATNDHDWVGDPIATQPAAGHLVRLAGSVFRYLPPPDWSGTDTFSYTIADPNANTATATVTITVNPTPDPPDRQQRHNHHQRRPTI